MAHASKENVSSDGCCQAIAVRVQMVEHGWTSTLDQKDPLQTWGQEDSGADRRFQDRHGFSWQPTEGLTTKKVLSVESQTPLAVEMSLNPGLSGVFRVSYGRKIPDDHLVLTWMVQHASTTYNLFHRSLEVKDGKTPHSRLRGRVESVTATF